MNDNETPDEAAGKQAFSAYAAKLKEATAARLAILEEMYKAGHVFMIDSMESVEDLIGYDKLVIQRMDRALNPPIRHPGF